MDVEMCIVPGCNNKLDEEEKEGKIPICSSCEAAGMHLCGRCSKKLSVNRIKDGSTLCEKCESDPIEMEETGTAILEVEYGEEESDPDDFMI